MAPKNLSDVWYQYRLLCASAVITNSITQLHLDHYQSDFRYRIVAIRGHDDDITAAPDDTSDTAICGFPTNYVRRTHMVSLCARGASAGDEVQKAVVSQLRN